MNQHPTELELSVLKTVCWFSVTKYPLTSFEIWKWLLSPDRSYDLYEVISVLQTSDWVKNRLIQKDGFYVLKDGLSVDEKINSRKERFLDSIRKYSKLVKASRYFRLLPGVRAVAAVNTLSWWNTTQSSDIDLFIITKPKTIWSSRFLLVLPFALLGRRPVHHDCEDDQNALDPFCFSFFTTQHSINFEDLKYSKKDYYLSFWCKSIVPIFDKDKSFQQFSDENKWCSVDLPNAKYRISHPLHSVKGSLFLPVQTGVTEYIFKLIQKNRFPEHIKELANIDSRVVINDNMLKFHQNDRREFFYSEYEKSINSHICIKT